MMGISSVSSPKKADLIYNLSPELCGPSAAWVSTSSHALKLKPSTTLPTLSVTSISIGYCSVKVTIVVTVLTPDEELMVELTSRRTGSNVSGKG